MIHNISFMLNTLHKYLGEVPLPYFQLPIWAVEDAKFFFVHGVNIDVPPPIFQQIKKTIVAEKVLDDFSDGWFWHFYSRRGAI